MLRDTRFRGFPRRTSMLALSLCAGICAGPAWADATSSNTLSFELKFRDAETNRNGHSQIGKFNVDDLAAPAGQGSLATNHAGGIATLTLTAPQNVVSVSPNGSDAKTTAAAMLVRLANITGSGGGSDPASPIDPLLSASFTWMLDDTLVDDPVFDAASSAYFVHFLINGVEAYSDTLQMFDPLSSAGTKVVPLPQFLLPANSITTLEARISLVAAVSSTRPPELPPPPVIPPDEPRYPSMVPEPSTWLLLVCGFGALGATLRRRPLAPRLV